MRQIRPLLSVVVPVYNEAGGLPEFHAALIKVVAEHTNSSYEVIYCNDGSTDDSERTLRTLAAENPRVRVLKLARNFGKEIALTAGIQHAHGRAVLSLDADGQHPVELIPEFLAAWQAGAKVVIGVRRRNQKEGLIKRFGSKFFYAFFSRVMDTKLTAGATDFRLIDQAVQQEFSRLTERRRMTRALIDWMGYERTYIPFTAKARQTDRAGYSFSKLFKLAIDSTISMSLSPLYITAYIGAIVLPLSTLLGLGMLINALLGDPLNLHATGGAYVLVLVLFLIGILLVSQGIIGLYLSHIHTETQNRPLYILDEATAVKEKHDR